MEKVININDKVKVKLTEEAKAYYTNKIFTLIGKDPILPKEDENGWSEWQLWHLMNDFGSLIFMGSNKLPFKKNEIKFTFED